MLLLLSLLLYLDHAISNQYVNFGIIFVPITSSLKIMVIRIMTYLL